MPGIARVGVDKAGGIVTGNLAPTVFVNGSPIVVKGAAIAGHGLGPHAGPVMDEASSDVFACGIPICRSGDLATCGHPVTGSGNVLTGFYANPGPTMLGVSKFGIVKLG
ncbi:MAG: PAAR domain-containing protein [Sediminibacterium sp.]|jgi:uncharacterized Zn-binding protein involved in type VI secretion